MAKHTTMWKKHLRMKRDGDKPNGKTFNNSTAETESKFVLTFIGVSVTVSAARFVEFAAVCEVRNWEKFEILS